MDSRSAAAPRCPNKDCGKEQQLSLQGGYCGECKDAWLRCQCGAGVSPLWRHCPNCGADVGELESLFQEAPPASRETPAQKPEIDEPVYTTSTTADTSGGLPPPAISIASRRPAVPIWWRRSAATSPARRSRSFRSGLFRPAAPRHPAAVETQWRRSFLPACPHRHRGLAASRPSRSRDCQARTRALPDVVWICPLDCASRKSPTR